MPKKGDRSFFEDVWQVVRLIPPGRVTSYGAIGRYLGAASSARMVGWALISHETMTPSVPGHRVVNRSGLLSARHHYKPPDRMQELLEAEGIEVKEDQVVKFRELFWDPTLELL